MHYPFIIQSKSPRSRRFRWRCSWIGHHRYYGRNSHEQQKGTTPEGFHFQMEIHSEKTTKAHLKRNHYSQLSTWKTYAFLEIDAPYLRSFCIAGGPHTSKECEYSRGEWGKPCEKADRSKTSIALCTSFWCWYPTRTRPLQSTHQSSSRWQPSQYLL